MLPPSGAPRAGARGAGTSVIERSERERRDRFRRLGRAAIALALCASSPPPARPGPSARRAIVADPAAAGSARLDGEVWIAENDLYVARIALLGDEARRRWLRESAAVEVDPFAAARGHAGPAFLTFLLSVERRGAGTLYFQPLACPVSTGQGVLVNPLDLASIESSYAMTNRLVPPAYEAALGKVLLHRPIVLAPGGRATGLLAYPARDLDARALRLEVRLTNERGDSVPFEVGYRRVKIEEEPAKR